MRTIKQGRRCATLGGSIAIAVVALAAALPAEGVGAGNGDASSNPVTIAVIGDVPYGTGQEASFPALVNAVNTDSKVRLVAHVGDIKSGSTTCTDERFSAVAEQFAHFKDPLVYTPGDNEWTDCHRVNNGAYNPLERLDKVRSLFFSQPGQTLGGRNKRVEFQPDLVENVCWVESQAVFATLHVIGSNNGLAPWTGLDWG